MNIHEGCDRCGRGLNDRPIRQADVQIVLSNGEILLCDSHYKAHEEALGAKALTVVNLREKAKATS